MGAIVSAVGCCEMAHVDENPPKRCGWYGTSRVVVVSTELWMLVDLSVVVDAADLAAPLLTSSAWRWCSFVGVRGAQ